MKKVFGFFAGLLVLLSNGAVMAQPADAGNSLLWKVTGNGLKQPSFVFGTIHLICKDDYLWTPAMQRALDSSSKLCLEMDMDDMNVMMAAQTGLMDMHGKKLSEYFTDMQYRLLSEYVKDSIGIEMMMLEMMKPIALQMLMTARVSYCDSPVSYEEQIMDVVKGEGKEIIGLETPEEQISALESIPADSVVASIMKSIMEDNGDRGEYNRLVGAFKKQNIDSLHKIIMESEDVSSSTSVLLTDRNDRWISRMKGMMDKSSVFFAVGAGHLAGKKGVLALLRAQGYEVVPVK